MTSLAELHKISQQPRQHSNSCIICSAPIQQRRYKSTRTKLTCSNICYRTWQSVLRNPKFSEAKYEALKNIDLDEDIEMQNWRDEYDIKKFLEDETVDVRESSKVKVLTRDEISSLVKSGNITHIHNITRVFGESIAELDESDFDVVI